VDIIHKFIYSEPCDPENPTIIGPGYIVKIGQKYYRVLGSFHRGWDWESPVRFIYRPDSGKSIHGWRFYAVEITDPEIIQILNEWEITRGELRRKIACLVLDPNNVEEVEER